MNSTSRKSPNQAESPDPTLSFQEVWRDDPSGSKHLLYGNGLAQALDQRYGYSELFESMLPHLPDDLAQVISCHPNITDVESFVAVMREQLGAEDDDLLDLNPEEVRKRVDRAINLDRGLDRDVWVALARQVLELHDEASNRIDSDTAGVACDFLHRFDRLFTVNYDLLWLYLEEACSSPEGIFHPVHIHGGLHLMTNQPCGLYQGAGDSVEVDDLLDGLSYVDVLEKIRERIDGGGFPALVMGDTHIRKQQRIDSVYGVLDHPDPLDVLRRVGGSLYTFGWSGSREDNHILETIGAAASLERFYLGVYRTDDVSTMERAAQTIGWIQAEREKRGNPSLVTGIYSTQGIL